MTHRRLRSIAVFWVFTWGIGAQVAVAGPPFITDDPEPTPWRHYEIYTFAQGASSRDGSEGSTGIDLNYGAAPDLQLTAVLPIGISAPRGGSTVAGIGNVELAAKYKILHQETVGIDVAIFPRVFLPSPSREVGERHGSFLLPLWIGRDFGTWSSFGGGGCVLNRGGGSQDYCIAGIVVSKRISQRLMLGAEFYHETADTRGGKPSSIFGGGFVYDLSDTYHLMGWFGPGLQDPAVTAHYDWYTALQITL